MVERCCTLLCVALFDAKADADNLSRTLVCRTSSTSLYCMLLRLFDFGSRRPWMVKTIKHVCTSMHDRTPFAWPLYAVNFSAWRSMLLEHSAVKASYLEYTLPLLFHWRHIQFVPFSEKIDVSIKNIRNGWKHLFPIKSLIKNVHDSCEQRDESRNT